MLFIHFLMLLFVIYHVGGENNSKELPKFQQVLPNGVIRSSPFNPADRNWSKEKPILFGPGPELSTRIVGGREAFENEFPYNVLIFRTSLQTQGWCTGAIYNEVTIITAAHCAFEGRRKVSSREYRVFAGKHHLQRTDASEVRRNVRKIFTHPKYRFQPPLFDIAVFKLSKPLTFSKVIQPIPIAEENSQPQGDITISGFGYTRQVPVGIGQPLLDPQFITDTLKVSTVKFVTKENCAKIYRQFRDPEVQAAVGHEKMFCALGETNDGVADSICYGDSGGPAVCVDGNNKEYLCGVISAGVGCGVPGLPGFYGNVAFYSSWIKEAANGSLRILSPTIVISLCVIIHFTLRIF